MSHPTLIAQRTITLTYDPSLLPTFGWLLHLSIEWQPSKAKGQPIALFFDVAQFNAPKTSTDNSEHKLAAGHLQWIHGEPRHHALGSWWMHPWRYSGKVAGGRKGGRGSSCCCCVLCVLVLLPLAVGKIQVPLKSGTCFTYFVRRYLLIPVKSGTRSCFSKCQNPSSIIGFLRNPAGMYSLGREYHPTMAKLSQCPKSTKKPS